MLTPWSQLLDDPQWTLSPLTLYPNGSVSAYGSHPTYGYKDLYLASCATDVTSQLTLTNTLSRSAQGKTRVTLTYKNTSGAPITGPISLATAAPLLNSEGTTACSAPAGDLYRNARYGDDLLTGKPLAANDSIQVDLMFRGAAPTFTKRLLAGEGLR